MFSNRSFIRSIVTSMHPLLRLSFFCFTLMLFCGGCTRTLIFTVVDAESKRPLAGVGMKVRETYDDMLIVREPRVTHSPLSDANGIIKVNLRNDWNQTFDFEKDGYWFAYFHRGRSRPNLVFDMRVGSTMDGVDATKPIEIYMRSK